MTPPIEYIDKRSAPETVLAGLHELWSIRDAEMIPGEQPEPFQQFLLDMRNTEMTRLNPIWAIRDDEKVVASAEGDVRLDQDPDNAFAFLYVHPDHRGNGHARALMAPLLTWVEEQGRTRLGTDTAFGHPGGGLAEAAGLKPVMTAKRSRLLTSEIDRDLMRTWIERAEERASDYELIMVSTPVPEDIVEEFVQLMHVMNTAPMEEFEEQDHKWTVEIWRRRERITMARKGSVWVCLARQRETGDFAGYTSLLYQRLYPAQAWQWDTGVDPAHRNRGLGRWLKAAMAEHLLATHPEIERIDTFNAGSNEPMLNINIAMGFKPLMIEQVYQGPTSAVRAWLDGEGARTT